MRAGAGRLTKLVVLATLALAVTAAGGNAASPARGRILGVVPHVSDQPFTAGALGSAAATSLTFDASYETLINRYLSDVAAAGAAHATDNVYSVATQYYDGSGNVQYQSTFGGSYEDKDPLPASACNDRVDPYCLTDTQLQHEIQTVLTANGWHGGLDHAFFLMTPNGVGSCFNGTNTECGTNTFCAYHSAFIDSSSEDVIYANEPYEGPSGGCADPSQGFPNDTDADTTVNTISHEHNESITDPLGNGWIAADGSEDGDLCAFGFGAQTGTGVSAYNQVINGDHYDLQEEWSQAANGTTGGCVQSLGGPTSPQPTGDGSGPLAYHNGPVMHTNTTYAIYWLPTAGSVSAPAVTGTAAVNQPLTSSPGTWTASPTTWTYQWQACSSATTGCTNIAGATGSSLTPTPAEGGKYVRSTVSAENVNGASAYVASAGVLVVPFPQSTKAPHISGRAKVGRRLSATRGSWSGTPTSYKLQWLRCNAHGGSCGTIGGATHTAYKLTKRDSKHRLRVRVTAVNVAGSTKATSNATARVPAAKKH